MALSDKPISRIVFIDGLRGYAALAIMFFHSGPNIIDRIHPGHFKFLMWIPSLLYQAVPLFFVISGFVITRNLLTVRTSTCYFKTFYLRRFFRLIPLYALVITFYFILVECLPLNSELRKSILLYRQIPLWPYLFFIQNFFMVAYHTYGCKWLGVTWSLAVEEQFYLLLPALMRTVSKPHLTFVLKLGFLASLAFNTWVNFFRPFPLLAAYLLLLSCLSQLSVGCFLALRLEKNSDIPPKVNRFTVALLITSAVLSMSLDFLPSVWMNPLRYLQPLLSSLFYGCLLTLLLASRLKHLRSFFESSVMVTLGNWSYCCYLTHTIVINLFFIWNGQSRVQLASFHDGILCLASILATLVIAAMSWKFIERPLQTYARRYKYS